jgi:hypothetical protein
MKVKQQHTPTLRGRERGRPGCRRQLERGWKTLQQRGALVVRSFETLFPILLQPAPG